RAGFERIVAGLDRHGNRARESGLTERFWYLNFLANRLILFLKSEFHAIFAQFPCLFGTNGANHLARALLPLRYGHRSESGFGLLQPYSTTNRSRTWSS